MNNEPTLNELMENLNAIVYNKATESYALNVRWVETVEINVSLPVYTGNMAANGRLNTSKRIRSKHATTRSHNRSENYEVCKEIAKAIGRQMLADGRIGNRSDFGDEIVQDVLSVEVAADMNGSASTDWREVMEQQESIAADNIAWTR